MMKQSNNNTRFSRSHWSTPFWSSWWPLLLLIAFSYGLLRCGSSKRTSAGAPPMDGLPSDWTGISDYDAGGWGFDEP